MNAGTLYKALSYACLYKAETGAADIFDADTTVSIVREEKPVKLLAQPGEKNSVTKKKAGIYRIDAREPLDNCAGLGSDEDRLNADSVVNVASAKLADSAAEIAKPKKLLAEAGITEQ